MPEALGHLPEPPGQLPESLGRLPEGARDFGWHLARGRRRGRRREMTLPVEEFIRRFLLHILPHRFVRIRYYGLFANRHRERQLARCRALLDAAPSAPVPDSDEREAWESVYRRVTGKDPTLCTHCGHGHLRQVRKLPALARRPPP